MSLTTQTGWELLVTREGSFWKNYMMLESLEETKRVLGFTLEKHLTTREGDTFTHWSDPAAVKKFSQQVLQRLQNDKNFFDWWQALFIKAKKDLIQYSSQLAGKSFQECTNKELLADYEIYNRHYLALYPPFHITAYTSTIDEALKIQPDNIVLKKFISIAAQFRLEGRQTFMESDERARPLFEMISKRIGEEAGSLLPEEVRECLLDGLVVNKKRIANRKKQCALLWGNDQIKIIEGENAKKYLPKQNVNQANILKGTVARPGGVLKGTVRLVKTGADTKKLGNGDILVARMTTADLLPAIRATKGIVGIITDEGGTTCHAAVIARELHVPCVVGTRFATKFLHDGDEVSLDSNTGIVTKV